MVPDGSLLMAASASSLQKIQALLELPSPSSGSPCSLCFSVVAQEEGATASKLPESVIWYAMDNFINIMVSIWESPLQQQELVVGDAVCVYFFLKDSLWHRGPQKINYAVICRLILILFLSGFNFWS